MKYIGNNSSKQAPERNDYRQFFCCVFQDRVVFSFSHGAFSLLSSLSHMLEKMSEKFFEEVVRSEK